MRAMKLAVLGLAVSFTLVARAWAVAEIPPDSDLTTIVPEPGTMALLLTGIGIGAAAFLRRRK